MKNTQKSAIMARANKLAAKYGRSEALKMAWRAERIISEMQSGTASFSFTKQDGTNREACGTLNADLYAAYWQATGESRPAPADQVKYFDMGVNQWRSFNLSRLNA